MPLKDVTPFLAGSITRRIFAVFLVFALLPVCVFSWLAMSRLSEATEQQVADGLETETRNLSYLVLERLGFAQQLLAIYREQAGTSVGEADGLVEKFSAADEFDIQLLPTARVLPLLDTTMQARLNTGRTVLLGNGGTAAGGAPLMLQALDGGLDNPAIASVAIHGNQVLGAPDRRNLLIDSCVLDTGARVLFASNPALCKQFLQAAPQTLDHSGEVVFGGEAGFYARYRSLFLNQKFGSGDWMIVTMRPREELFLASVLFRQNFIAVALGLILSLSLASIYFIRTRMSPLASIMAGIERVSAKQYNEPVQVDSGDEFEELAQAFNSMSTQVSRQLDTMASMAEIDQLILTRKSIEDVIQLVTERSHSVVRSDAVYLALVDADLDDDERNVGHLSSVPAAVYAKRDRHAGASRVGGILLEAELVESLARGPAWLERESCGGTPAAVLFSSVAPEINDLFVLPLKREQRLVGIIALGFALAPALDAEAESAAMSFANRISVALANAEWEDRLFQQAHFDELTGLPNRLSMLNQLDMSIKQSQRSGHAFAVSFIDLDDFKLVNDALGHMAGDAMIAIVAHRLQQCMRAGDTVARMGGDEFVIISEAFDDTDSAMTAMSSVATKIQDTIAEPLEISDREIRSSTSIGVAIYPRDGQDAETLLRNADTAMYSAKGKGRGKMQFFSDKLNRESVALMNLSSDMKAALKRNEFELYYQPKMSLANEEMVGAEALIRWNHPARGLIGPGEFIEAAERMGLISAIGDWTLHAACRQIKQWQQQGYRPPRVSVNMSAIQIHEEDILGKIESLLDAYQLEPELLELEIVEGVLLDDLEATSRKLAAVRRLGVHISIDDYGTGYSSLSYIRRFPVDTLKIDRCFISNICTDPADRAIVNSTIVLAQSLNMQVIAEGVETAEQAALLRSLGCDQVQGYLYAKPAPAGQFRLAREVPARSHLRLVPA